MRTYDPNNFVIDYVLKALDKQYKKAEKKQQEEDMLEFEKQLIESHGGYSDIDRSEIFHSNDFGIKVGPVCDDEGNIIYPDDQYYTIEINL